MLKRTSGIPSFSTLFRSISNATISNFLRDPLPVIREENQELSAIIVSPKSSVYPARLLVISPSSSSLPSLTSQTQLRDSCRSTVRSSSQFHDEKVVQAFPYSPTSQPNFRILTILNVRTHMTMNFCNIGMSQYCPKPGNITVSNPLCFPLTQ
jgi:hypothetical protein